MIRSCKVLKNPKKQNKKKQTQKTRQTYCWLSKIILLTALIMILSPPTFFLLHPIYILLQLHASFTKQDNYMLYTVNIYTFLKWFFLFTFRSYKDLLPAEFNNWSIQEKSWTLVTLKQFKRHVERNKRSTSLNCHLSTRDSTPTFFQKGSYWHINSLSYNYIMDENQQWHMKAELLSLNANQCVVYRLTRR